MAPQNLFSNLSSSAALPSPKMHVTVGSLPTHIDLKTQPSSSRPPFRQLHANQYISRTTLLLPSFLASASSRAPTQQEIPVTSTTSTSSPIPIALPPPSIIHAKCFLAVNDIIRPSSPLLSLIQTPGTLNFSVLSEGSPGVDDMFYLHAGALTINISRERYEKMGIPGGVAVKSGARKHGKQGERREVQVDLRSVTAKMLERWRWAVREVWVERVECRVGVDGGTEDELVKARGLLDDLAAVWLDGAAQERVQKGIRVPLGLLTQGVAAEGVRLEQDADTLWNLAEWADLVALGSQRVAENDSVDAFVASYETPEQDAPKTATQDVAVLTWEGLIPTRWVADLLLRLAKVSRTQRHDEGRPWAVLSINNHQIDAVGNVDGCTILLQPDDAGSGSTTRGGGRRDTLREQGDRTSHNDDEMDLEEIEVESKALPAASDRSAGSSGLQRFMCLQFVDSRVHS